MGHGTHGARRVRGRVYCPVTISVFRDCMLASTGSDGCTAIQPCRMIGGQVAQAVVTATTSARLTLLHHRLCLPLQPPAAAADSDASDVELRTS